MLPVSEFFYSTTVPKGAVAVAQVRAPDYSPSDLVQIVSVSTAAPLTATQYPSGVSGTVFTAPGLGSSVAISGANNYLMGNQFFQITDHTDTSAAPLYYVHRLPVGVSNVSVLDNNGNPVTDWVFSTITWTDGAFPAVLHSLDPTTYYQIRYFDSQGFIWTRLLSFSTLYQPASDLTSLFSYTYANAQLGVPSAGTFWIRFQQQAGWQLLPPYDTLPNNPWYARIRFSPSVVPMEYSQQNWSPLQGYLFAAWVSGEALDASTIQFERQSIYAAAGLMPDIIVYDADYNLKYALAGSSNRSGILPWTYNQVLDIDPSQGRVRVQPALLSTDKVFGFYSYREYDLEFRSLDLNPYINPQVVDNVINFYYKTNGANVLSTIYYQIVDSSGNPVVTNDTAPSTGTNIAIGSLMVGSNVGASQFTIWDARIPGGGLSVENQSSPEATSFFDIGYWDGKPYPLNGVQIVYVPSTLLSTLGRDTVSSLIHATLPVHSLPLIRYYDPQTGYETL